MELSNTILCVCLLTTSFFAAIFAEDFTKPGNNDAFEKLLGRVDRLEENNKDQQNEINELRSQLSVQKKRTKVLENIVRRLKEKESKVNVNHSGNPGIERKRTVAARAGDAKTVSKRADGGSIVKTAAKRTGWQKIRQTEVYDTAPVAFFSTLSAPVTHMGVHQAVIFDKVVTNDGNAYNPHIGAFVAPSAGTYAFFVTMTTYDTHFGHYYLAVNGNAVSRFFINGPSSPWEQTSQSAIVRLQTGDDVTVRINDADKTINGDNYTTFGGFLIHSVASTDGQIVGK